VVIKLYSCSTYGLFAKKTPKISLKRIRLLFKTNYIVRDIALSGKINKDGIFEGINVWSFYFLDCCLLLLSGNNKHPYA